MKVSLIDYTGSGHIDPARFAAAILLFTKNTRLEMDLDGIEKIFGMRPQELVEELEKMAATIPSSWEFVSYTFLIRDVTRAFTHQLVRTRNASYAQQTMRIIDMGNFNYLTPMNLPGHCVKRYEDQMEEIAETYAALIDAGAKPEDARGVLPTNICTNIVMGCNLRTLAELALKRSSPRVQGEYRMVLVAMIEAVLQVHPWAELFLNRENMDIIDEIDEIFKRHGLDQEARNDIWKRIDQIRRQE